MFCANVIYVGFPLIIIFFCAWNYLHSFIVTYDVYIKKVCNNNRVARRLSLLNKLIGGSLLSRHNIRIWLAGLALLNTPLPQHSDQRSSNYSPNVYLITTINLRRYIYVNTSIQIRVNVFKTRQANINGARKREKLLLESKQYYFKIMSHSCTNYNNVCERYETYVNVRDERNSWK